MEKKNNSMFKAVSVISLILAIINSVWTVATLVVALVDFEAYTMDFVEASSLVGSTYVSVEVTEAMMEEATIFATSYLIASTISMGITQAVLYVAFEKFKTYQSLTDEEASVYSGKLVAWIVVLFLFAGLLLGILAWIGYNNVTKQQIESYKMQKYMAMNPNNEQHSSPEANDAPETRNTAQDLDLMMARLEKLQRIKEMGGLTDEEYEKLRKDIVNKK